MSCSRNGYATVWSPSCNITNSTTQVQSYKTHCGCLKYHLMNVFENEGRGCLVWVHAWMYSKLHWGGVWGGSGGLGPPGDGCSGNHLVVLDFGIVHFLSSKPLTRSQYLLFLHLSRLQLSIFTIYLLICIFMCLFCFFGLFMIFWFYNIKKITLYKLTYVLQ